MSTNLKTRIDRIKELLRDFGKTAPDKRGAACLLVAIEGLEGIHESSPMGEDSAWDVLELIAYKWEGKGK